MPWTEDAGETRWYLYHLADSQLLEDTTPIIQAIRCLPETPRHCELQQASIGDIRLKVEKHIKNTWLKRMQAPVGVKPILMAWMELN